MVRRPPPHATSCLGAITVVSGFVYTVFSELMNTVLHAHWAYSELMPVVTMGPIG